MARYRKVDTRIWNDEKFMALSDNGKLAFFLVMTNQNMTALGAMRATVPGLAVELRWPLSKFKRAFYECLQTRMLVYDNRSAFVALPNFLRYNAPESPNVVSSWSESFDLLPECEEKHRVARRAVEYVDALVRVKGFGEGWAEALPKSLRESASKSCPNQDPEQEQEQDKDPLKAPRRGAGRDEPAFSPAEIAWRVTTAWAAHLEAWRRHFRAENGVDPHPEPSLTPEILGYLQRGLRIYDRHLLGHDQRERWERESKVRAAGIGIYLSPWHIATDPKNDRRSGGKQYLEHWRPWKHQRGKGDPVETFADLYFRASKRCAA